MKKSPHLAIQKALISFLPGAKMEAGFPEISRIADVAYFPEKLIFEVQCSSINLREVQKRNRDYGSLGFTVIWILHDHCFNKKVLSPAELYLRTHLAYYTSITQFGHGFFYDQIEFLNGALRIYRGAPSPLKDFHLKRLEKIPSSIPKAYQKKLKNSPFYLEGDVVDSLVHTKKGRETKKLEKSYFPEYSWKFWYKNSFEFLLKKSADQEHSFSLHTS